LQTGFLGLWGDRVDAIDFYTAVVNKLSEEVSSAFYVYFTMLITKKKFYSILNCEKKKNERDLS